MKTITIKKEDINIPERFEDLTLNQFMKIEKSKEKMIDIKSNSSLWAKWSLEFIGILINKDYNYVVNLKDDDINLINQEINQENFKQVRKDIEFFEINGVEYVPKNDLNTITIGEKIELAYLTEGSIDIYDIYFNIASVLIRPGSKQFNIEQNKDIWLQNDYNTLEIPFRKQFFIDNLKAVDALQTIYFFLNGTNESNKTLVKSSNKKVPVKKAKVSQK